MPLDKPFSQACENNKAPILKVIKPLLSTYSDVLEVGSGTGQHSVYFARVLSHLTWHCSDRAINHAGILSWHEEADLDNLRGPIELDLNNPWPVKSIPVIYTANTLHIISEVLVEKFFCAVETHLEENGLLIIYGPFNYDGCFTSESNAMFDNNLRQRDPLSGIRDIEWIVGLANKAGLNHEFDHEMPANNRLLVFKR